MGQENTTRANFPLHTSQNAFLWRPLDRALDNAIEQLATSLLPDGFEISATAPQTLEALKTHLDAGRRM